MIPTFASLNSISFKNCFTFFNSSNEITWGIKIPIFFLPSETLFIALSSAFNTSGCFIPNLIPCIPNMGFASTSFGAPSKFSNSSVLISEVLTQTSSKYSAMPLIPL